MSEPTPVAWQPKYKQDVIDHHKNVGSGLWEYAMSVYPTMEAAEGYGHGGNEVRPLYSSEALQALREENEQLRAGEVFTLSDASRLLRKQDVQGACPNPDDCFYFGDRVRCGPCAVKASAAKGIVVDDTHSHLPEVCRLRREVKAAEARATAAEARLEEALKVISSYVERDENEGVTLRSDEERLRAARRFMEESQTSKENTDADH